MTRGLEQEKWTQWVGAITFTINSNINSTKIYQHEILQVHECSKAANTGKFIDPISRIRHQLNTNLEVNNFQSTVIGSLSYNRLHSHCIGMDSDVDSNRMESLFVTESLEVTIRTVMIREEFDTGDIIVKENGVSILAMYRQDLGMIANFGTLMFQRHRPPCQWKRVWDISAIRKPHVGLGGIGLIDDDQHVHVTLHDTVAEAPILSGQLPME